MNSFLDLDWKYKNPHTYKIKVSEDDIDILGHTNNKVYLTWCEKVSWDHSSSLGVRPEDYKKLNCACVVISSENNFLGSLFKDDNAIISTWITKTDSKLRLSRCFQVINLSNKKTVFMSNVNYACISLETFRPVKMPPLFRECYRVTT